VYLLIKTVFYEYVCAVQTIAIMHKFLLTAVAVFFSYILTAQQKYTSWLSLGVGRAAVFSPSPGGFTQLHSMWHHLAGGRHDFVLSGSLGWNRNLFFTPDQLYLQTTTAISYGQRTQLTPHLFFTPAIGVGIMRQTMTHFYSTTDALENQLLSLIFNRNSNDQIYDSYRERNIGVPVSLNFLYTSRFAGLEAGLEIMFTKRPVAGVRLCMSVGKMYRKALK
jgi:hypothetical protein